MDFVKFSTGLDINAKIKFMKRLRLMLVTVAAGGLSAALATIVAPIHSACAQHAQTSYAEDVVPILKGYCMSCHQAGGEGYTASGLDLTSYEGLMKGT
jgi:hypothetical protein